MDSTELKAMIARLLAEEEVLTETIRRADVQLSQVRAALSALTALESDEPMEFDGKLADACRAVLKKNAHRAMSPVEVRDEMKSIGYDVTKHNNVMASVHSVLKRLKESGEVKAKPGKDGSGTRYTWAGPSEGVKSNPMYTGVTGPLVEAAKAAAAMGVYADTAKLMENMPLAQAVKQIQEFQRSQPFAELSKKMEEIAASMQIPSVTEKK